MKPAIALALVLTACSSGNPDGGDPSKDKEPPVLTIESPMRGAMSDGTKVLVSGTAIDTSAVTEVTVNGQQAELAGGGVFRLEIDGVEGINVLDIRANDAAGNQARDVRAVLIGNLVDQSTPVTDGIVARIGAPTIDVLGDMVSDIATNTDLEPIALALNPVVNTGDGCNSAKVYVESVDTGAVPVNVAPAPGGIDADVSVKNIEVHGRVTFRALCIGGSASWKITANSYDVGGLIKPRIGASGKLKVDLEQVTSSFKGFNLDVGGIPGFVENLFEGQVRDKLAGIIRDEVLDMVPPMANAFLADVLADSYSISLLGQRVDVHIKPTNMVWDASGGNVRVEVSTSIEGVAGASYLSTPMPSPAAAMTGDGLQVGLADDVANQLFAAMWAAGSFELALETGNIEGLMAFFPRADRVDVKFSLPPVVSAGRDDIVSLSLGDVIITIIDDDEGLGTLAEVAISAQVDLTASLSADGELVLGTGDPLIAAQVLEQSPELYIPLDEAKVVAFAELAIKQFSRQADDLLGTLPIPSFGGATVATPTMQPLGGYLLLGGQLTAN